MTAAPPPDTTSGANNSDERPQGSGDIPRVEWIAAAFGVILLLGAVWVLLATQGLDPSPRPPTIAVQVEEVTPVPGAWPVRFAADNRGDESIAGLRLTGTLSRAGAVVETADVQLDYVPARSVRRGGLYMSHDPRSGTFEIRPSGFQEP